MWLTTLEPEHRLVARTLERQWEEALAGAFLNCGSLEC